MNKIFSTALPADNAVLITRLLLRRLQVKVTDTAVRDALLSHPDYPSLLSISDSLHKWKVDAVGMKISAGLDKVPCPFIAPLNDFFVIVESVDETAVAYVTDQGVNERMALHEFEDGWSGIALLVEKNDDSGEIDYRENKRQEYWKNHRVLYGFVALIVIGAVPAATSFNSIAFFICSAIGMLVTAMLLWYEYDQSNDFLKSVCALVASGGCGEVLASKGARIGNVSMSEIGFVYFSGGFIYQAITGNAFGLISWFAAPFILYSIFYQAVIIKRWCMLCLVVQALLLSQVLLTQTVWFSLYVLPAFLLPALAWFAAKPYIYEAKEKRRLQYQLAKIKNNAGVFYRILQSQKPMNALRRSAGITLGNESAQHLLVKVCNPYCNPCAKAHPKIDRLLDSGHWKVQIIFTAGDSPKENDAYAAAYLLTKAAGNDARNMLQRWYTADRHNDKLFASREAAVQNLQSQREQLKYMYNWCAAENITHTPTIYVNGYRLPDGYDINDLEFLNEKT